MLKGLSILFWTANTRAIKATLVHHENVIEIRQENGLVAKDRRNGLIDVIGRTKIKESLVSG